MALDDEETVQGLDRAREVFRSSIRGQGGRVIDMAGDSVLAVFDTAAGAVRASMDIQGELARLFAQAPVDRAMAFRIGVHLGDVIEKSDGTVYGDGVNIASRLQALAKPGSTVVSQAIRDAVRARTGMVFLDLGEHSAKNISEPVRAFQCATASSETEVSKTAPTAESPANRPSANTRAKRPMLATSMAFLIMAT